MAVAGMADNPGDADMLAVAAACGVSRQAATQMLAQVRDAVNDWARFATQMGVSRRRTEEIGRVIRPRG